MITATNGATEKLPPVLVMLLMVFLVMLLLVTPALRLFPPAFRVFLMRIVEGRPAAGQWRSKWRESSSLG